jgi:Family of unknown function (DUF6519)
MSGDYSRRRFNKRMDFSTVLNQQGRVQLDSDWNELAEIMSRRDRVETVGTIGRLPNYVCWQRVDDWARANLR